MRGTALFLSRENERVGPGDFGVVHDQHLRQVRERISHLVDVQGDEIGQRVRRLGGEVEFGRLAEPDLLNRELLPKVARLGIVDRASALGCEHQRGHRYSPLWLQRGEQGQVDLAARDTRLEVLGRDQEGRRERIRFLFHIRRRKTVHDHVGQFVAQGKAHAVRWLRLVYDDEWWRTWNREGHAGHGRPAQVRMHDDDAGVLHDRGEILNWTVGEP
jgi:hypothetical protein